MPNVVTNPAKKNVLQAFLDSATTMKMMLLDTNHSNNIDSQEFIDDISANEVSGTGYTAGGVTITGLSAVADLTNDRAELTFDDVVFNAGGGSLTASYAVIYDDTGTPGTSRILAIFDFGGSQTATNDNFTVSPDAEGAVQIA